MAFVRCNHCPHILANCCCAIDIHSERLDKKAQLVLSRCFLEELPALAFSEVFQFLATVRVESPVLGAQAPLSVTSRAIQLACLDISTSISVTASRSQALCEPMRIAPYEPSSYSLFLRSLLCVWVVQVRIGSTPVVFHHGVLPVLPCVAPFIIFPSEEHMCGLETDMLLAGNLYPEIHGNAAEAFITHEFAPLAPALVGTLLPAAAAAQVKWHKLRAHRTYAAPKGVIALPFKGVRDAFAGTLAAALGLRSLRQPLAHPPFAATSAIRELRLRGNCLRSQGVVSLLAPVLGRRLPHLR